MFFLWPILTRCIYFGMIQDSRYDRIVGIKQIDHGKSVELAVLYGGIGSRSATVEIKSQLGQGINTTIVFYAWQTADIDSEFSNQRPYDTQNGNFDIKSIYNGHCSLDIAIQLELDAFSIMKHFVSLGVRTLRGYRRDLDKGTFND